MLLSTRNMPRWESEEQGWEAERGRWETECCLLWLPPGEQLATGVNVYMYTRSTQETQRYKLVDMNETLVKIEPDEASGSPRHKSRWVVKKEPEIEELRDETDMTEQNTELVPWVLPTLSFAAVVLFGFQPLMCAWSWKMSSCKAGAPALSYAPLAMYGVGIYAAEMFLVAGLRNANIFLNAAHRRIHQGFFVMLLDWWPLVICMGKTDAADFFTDGLQPGQVHACEQEVNLFADTYSQSWRGWFLVHDAAKQIGLSGFSMLVMIVASVLQGVRLVYSLWQARKLVQQESALLSMAETGMDFAQGAYDLSKVYEKIAEISEQLGATYLAKLYQEAAGSAAVAGTIIFAKNIFETDPQKYQALIDESIQHVELPQSSTEAHFVWADPHVLVARAIRDKTRAETIVGITMVGVFTRVIGEAAPSLLTALAFFNLSFDNAGFTSQIKTTLCMFFSITLCLTKVKKTYHAWHLTGNSLMLILSVLITLWTIEITIKFVAAFFCKSHMFNVIGWTCVHAMNHRGHDYA